MRYTVPLPPSVNSYHRSVPMNNGGSKVLISRDGRAWKKKALQLMAMQRPVLILGDVTVTIEVYFRDRRRDLDNAAKPLLDLLQAARVIENDRQVIRLVMDRYVDKGDPRVVITVESASTTREAA